MWGQSCGCCDGPGGEHGKERGDSEGLFQGQNHRYLVKKCPVPAVGVITKLLWSTQQAAEMDQLKQERTLSEESQHSSEIQRVETLTFAAPAQSG